MLETKEEILNVVKRAVKRTGGELRYDCNAWNVLTDAGLEAWAHTTVADISKFWSEEIDRIPFFAAKSLCQEKGMSMDLKISYALPEDKVCSYCIGWIRHRTIRLLDATYLFRVASKKDKEVDWTVRQV